MHHGVVELFDVSLLAVPAGAVVAVWFTRGRRDVDRYTSDARANLAK